MIFHKITSHNINKYIISINIYRYQESTHKVSNQYY
nr:MAG TPA: hypothetical protein [Caudoviricetes sp.]